VYLQGKVPWLTCNTKLSFVESTTSDTIAQRKRVIIHQRRGYLGEWANADKIDLLVLLLNFRIVRRKVKLLTTRIRENKKHTYKRGHTLPRSVTVVGCAL
jgi:hypothetical protein